MVNIFIYMTLCVWCVCVFGPFGRIDCEPLRCRRIFILSSVCIRYLHLDKVKSLEWSFVFSVRLVAQLLRSNFLIQCVRFHLWLVPSPLMQSPKTIMYLFVIIDSYRWTHIIICCAIKDASAKKISERVFIATFEWIKTNMNSYKKKKTG